MRRSLRLTPALRLLPSVLDMHGLAYLKAVIRRNKKPEATEIAKLKASATVSNETSFKRGTPCAWPIKQQDRANSLLNTCATQGLFNASLKTRLHTLVSFIVDGVPSIRNNMAAHGDGEEPLEVPRYFASFVLYETASTIIFLIDAFEASTE